MATHKLTNRYIQNLKAREKRFDVFDTERRGLRLRVSPDGTKRFDVVLRRNGRAWSQSLGEWPTILIDDARNQAIDMQRLVKGGLDPARARQEQTSKEERARRETVEHVCRQYLERRRFARPKTARNAESLLENHVIPTLGAMPVRELSEGHIKTLIERLSNGRDDPKQPLPPKPAVAAALLSTLKVMLEWGVEHGDLPSDDQPYAEMRPYLEDNVARKIKRPPKQAPRERVLDDAELGAVYDATDEIPFPYGAAYKFLILTGQRRGEVATMRWEQLAEDPRGRPIWLLPPESTKSARGHIVPLSSLATRVLDRWRVPGLAEGWVFPTRNDTPIQSFHHAKNSLDDLTGVRGWRTHDLRRTCASWMAANGVDPIVTEKLLNHAPAGSQGTLRDTYQRYDYLDQRREALDRWARHIQQLVAPELQIVRTGDV